MSNFASTAGAPTLVLIALNEEKVRGNFAVFS